MWRDSGLAFDDLHNVPLVATPPLPQPGYLQPTRDPAFGTPLVRITDRGQEMQPGIRCKPK